MTMPLDMTASLGARYLQPRVGSSHSRLNASGPIAHPALDSQREQQPAIQRRGQTSRDPLRPQWRGVLEAPLAWVYTGNGSCWQLLGLLPEPEMSGYFTRLAPARLESFRAR